MDSTVIDFDEIGAEGARAKLGVTFSDVKATVAVARGENSTAQHPVGSAMVTQKSLLPQGSAALNNCMPINRTSNSIARSMSEALTNSPLMKPTFFTTPMDAGTIKSKLSKAQSVEDGKHLPDHHDKGCNEESPEQPPIEDNSSKVGFLTRAYNTMQVVKAVALSSPLTVIGLPLIVFIILAGLGVYGTLAGANAYSQSLKDAATNAAVDTSTSFTLSVQQTFAPLLTLATYIQLSPDYTTVLPSFPQIADVLLSQLPNGTISTLQFSPFGVIRGEEPGQGHVGIDVFASPTLRGGAIGTLTSGQLTLSGPQNLVCVNNSYQGCAGYGGIARLPIFIANVDANETFGNNRITPTDLPLSQVYNNATRTKFWGFCTALVFFQDLLYGTDSRLSAITNRGYNYVLTRPNSTTGGAISTIVIAQSKTPPSGDIVSVTFPITTNTWTLAVQPSSGTWDAPWKWPVVAAVIIISFFIALLVFVVIVSLKQQGWVLNEMVRINQALAVATTHLEEEKARMDVMLVRQFNLIECFSNTNQANLDASSLAVANSSESSSTAQRIAAVKQQLNSDNVKGLAETEQVQTLEVLGEGAFGKVYKGLWRGTEVAVKTMMLPANMSGAEKREKMAVMEAAISSTLSHPNIVATYTYSVKPIRDSMMNLKSKKMTQATPGVLIADADGSMIETGKQSLTLASRQSAIHSYEVRLILEFCDRGCLKDAVEAQSFLDPSLGGLNYAAILDTALDISKAISHLHASNVVHGDIKARNVMLKASGDPRGFIAKVADFGLSVRMDNEATHMSDMFQGTLTHMAPEVLMEGKISKAADVYAFGMTLWELYTGCSPFSQVPRALLGHIVTKEHKRPMFPSNANRSFVALAEASWAPKEEDRPSFESILNTLMQLRKELGGQTPRVNLKGSLGAMPKANDIKMDSVAGGTVNEAEPLFEYTGGVAAAAPPPPPSSISGVQAGVHKLMGMGHGRDKLEPVTEERGSESMMASMKGLAVVIDAASEAR